MTDRKRVRVSELNKGTILHFLMTRFPHYKIDVKELSTKSTRFLLSDTEAGSTAYCDVDDRLLAACRLSPQEVETVVGERWKVMKPARSM